MVLIIILNVNFYFQADEDQSGSLEYEEFMQIVMGKQGGATCSSAKQ